MFIWPGMGKDIKKYVDACITCAQRKTSPHAKPAPLKQFDIPSKPFYRITMDVVGPLPVTAQRNRYILTVQDALTKYVEAFPMEDQKAPTVARTSSWDAKTSAHRPGNKFHVVDVGGDVQIPANTIFEDDSLPTTDKRSTGTIPSDLEGSPQSLHRPRPNGSHLP
ncbi:hypothetical protein JTB14_007331 [Gonioctena quinquepunctata]|nr:hypothetical protein JTB14_007331 [Gonioctena quinquepunctata]